MTVCVFELFSVGVGPSSSHTVGPMRAAHRFVAGLARTGDLLEVTRLEVDLYGSLAATGAGHGTLTAVLLGLEGHEPESISSETKAARIADMERTGRIRLGGLVELPFSANDIGCHPRVIRPRHPNAMELRASTRGGARLPAERYYSVGGGFVVTDASPTIRRLVRTYHSATAPDDVTVRFLLAAGAIGGLIKSGASISGADVGCQGEVGSAAAMAAGALAEIRSAWWSAEAGR